MTRPLDEIAKEARRLSTTRLDGWPEAIRVDPALRLIADLAEAVDRKFYRPSDGSSASSPSSPSNPYAAYWAEKERGDGLAYDLERSAAALEALRAENERLRAVVQKASLEKCDCKNCEAARAAIGERHDA